MAIYQGTYYSTVFLFSDSVGDPVDITGWEFEADFRHFTPDPDPEIFTLTMGDGIDIIDGPAGRLGMTISPVRTALLPLGKVVTDFMRIDVVGAQPIRFFGAKFKVRQPVTRF